MCLEGVQLYVMLVEVFEAERSRVKWYYTAAYGTLSSLSFFLFLLFLRPTQPPTLSGIRNTDILIYHKIMVQQIYIHSITKIN